jgi:dTMP kinase
MFIVLEGPNGVGKTTVARAVANQSGNRAPDVVVTREPSDSALGLLIRNMEQELEGEALCHACVADRLHHYATVIAPTLASGRWVVCDRYVPSSLVLQRLDGLELDRIWALNESAVPPDLTIYLADDPATLRTRLAQRGQLSRLEKAGGPTRELELYRDARRYLDNKGWRSLEIDCHGRDAEAVASEITERLSE